MGAIDGRSARTGLGGLCLVLMLAIGGMAFAPNVRAQTAAPSAASASLPASIPVKRDVVGEGVGPTGDAAWLAVASIGILLAFALIVARRRGGRVGNSDAGPWWTQLRSVLGATPSHEIERVSSMRLTPRHTLHVVVWEGRRLLVGCSENAVALLAESSRAPAPKDMP
jgi:flagellar protein FliO/FliZ